MRYNVPIRILEKMAKSFARLSENCQKILRCSSVSAACERMFSTAGNIFFLKHRRMSVLLFTTLVLLKLNQELL